MSDDYQGVFFIGAMLLLALVGSVMLAGDQADSGFQKARKALPFLAL